MKSLAVCACVALLAGSLMAQTTSPSAKASPTTSADMITIPAGTRVPLSLKQAISTKTAKEGDPVYAETAFPFALNDRIVIPTGTYIQGRISHVKRGGRIKGRAEIMIHFTSMIYPSGYTVMLPGSLENVPGAEKATVQGTEGTVRQDSDTGKKVGTVATTAGTGAAIGALSRGTLKATAIGAGVGGAAGLAVAMLTRGSDVRLEPGTSLEMEIQREVQVDGSRVTSRREVMVRNE